MIPVPMREDCKNFESRTYANGETVRKCNLDLAPEFLRTLEKGLKRIDDIIGNANLNKTKSIEGKAAFELFDTFGFPVDLTRLIAFENNLGVDEAGFEAEMSNRTTVVALQRQ